MIDSFIKNLKLICLNTEMVQQVSYGNILEYTQKSIKYPYINIDILDTQKLNGVLYHNVRLYVMDRNTNELITYNKCEIILDNILKDPELQIPIYYANPFTLNFKDLISGYYCDIQIPEVYLSKPKSDCDYPEESSDYTILDSGDYIKNDLSV